MRLSPPGLASLAGWERGEPIAGDGAGRRLAARLVDTGLLVVEARDAPITEVTVVIPVRDDRDGLADTLATIDAGPAVVVVDDASRDGRSVAAAVAGRAGTGLVTRDHPGGPGAARDTGWRASGGELVAFVDAGCQLPPGALARLTGHFADPAVVAVAPRVRSRAGRGTPGWLGAYEEHRSPLDLGAVPGPVRPASAIAYLPSATLVVRRVALEGAGGFDEALRTGEDVDLVWRLVGAGGRVRYDPAVVVTHPARPTLRAWAAQRAGYGRSAAPLAARHGDAVAPLTLSAWSAAVWTAAAAGRPRLAVGVTAASLARLRARRAPGLPAGVLVLAGARGHLRAGRAAAEAVRRTWWPIALVAAARSRRARRALLVAALVEPVATWVARRPSVGPLTWTALWVADDLAYGFGVWRGVVAERSAACLHPAR